MKNGKLLAAADAEFDAFITVDKNLVNQQKLGRFKIAVIVLRTPSNAIDTLAPICPRIVNLLDRVQPSSVTVLTVEDNAR